MIDTIWFILVLIVAVLGIVFIFFAPDLTDEEIKAYSKQYPIFKMFMESMGKDVSD